MSPISVGSSQPGAGTLCLHAPRHNTKSLPAVQTAMVPRCEDIADADPRQMITGRAVLPEQGCNLSHGSRNSEL